MRIAICEDEISDLKTLKVQIYQFFAEKKFGVEIDCFSCGEDFLVSQNEYQIIFMDIYLTGISGTDTVRNLCREKRSQIVFTTTSQEHAVEAFGLNAIHYLLKPLTQDMVNEAIERCFTQLEWNIPKILEVKNQQGVIPIPMENITYIEVFNKVSVIHTKKSDIQTHTSLDSLFELLDENCFLKPQRSFIVNMHYINTFFFDHIILQCGTEIVLSRSNRVALKNQYQSFLFKLARKGDI